MDIVDAWDLMRLLWIGATMAAASHALAGVISALLATDDPNED